MYTIRHISIQMLPLFLLTMAHQSMASEGWPDCKDTVCADDPRCTPDAKLLVERQRSCQKVSRGRDTSGRSFTCTLKPECHRMFEEPFHIMGEVLNPHGPRMETVVTLPSAVAEPFRVLVNFFVVILPAGLTF